MTTCGIATLKEREQSFRRAIDSIYGQVNKVIACLNHYPEIPKWAWDYPNMECWLSSNIAGASGKFLRVSQCEGYYLTLDDDLLVPEGYVKKMVEAADKYKCVVSLHGKRFDGQKPIKSYRKDFTTNIRCLDAWGCDTEVDVVGTGCCAFHTDHFKPHIFDFKYPNKVDVEFSALAHRAGVKLICLSHPKGYLQYIKPVGETIWQKEKDDTIATSIVNEFLSDIKAI